MGEIVPITYHIYKESPGQKKRSVPGVELLLNLKSTRNNAHEVVVVLAVANVSNCSRTMPKFFEHTVGF